MNPKMIKALQSYGRAWAVAGISLYVAKPDMQIKDLLMSSLIAVLAPLLRAMNPDDAEFGISKE